MSSDPEDWGATEPYYTKKNNPAQVAIDNLRELALYSPDCFFSNVVDDELFNLVFEGSAFSAGCLGTTDSSTLRRMYFLFMAEMLESNGGLPENNIRLKPPFDGVSWLFENHWITYSNVLIVREAERLWNEN